MNQVMYSVGGTHDELWGDLFSAPHWLNPEGI